VDRLAKVGELSEASIVDGVLKIIPPDDQEPEELEQLTRQAYAMLPRIKITDLLVEVDEWAGFTAHFTHLRNGEVVSDRPLQLSAILADGINLGISRMAEACPGTSASVLSRIATWHIREETYSKALAEIVNHHHQIEFAGYWGDGTTSSSDGQRFRTGGRGDARGQVNARYGTDPSVTFYTHVSDQYAPFYTKLINATVRDATHVTDCSTMSRTLFEPCGSATVKVVQPIKLLGKRAKERFYLKSQCQNSGTKIGAFPHRHTRLRVFRMGRNPQIHETRHAPGTGL
jgi:hypothetical protein